MDYFYHEKSGAAYRHLGPKQVVGEGAILAETNQRRGFLCVSDFTNGWAPITREQYDAACSGFRKVSRLVFLPVMWDM